MWSRSGANKDPVLTAVLMVRVAVTPSVSALKVAGVKVQLAPTGREAQAKVKFLFLASLLGVNASENVADCPAARLALLGEAMSGPAAAVWLAVLFIASPKTVLGPVPEPKLVTCSPESNPNRTIFEVQKSAAQNDLRSRSMVTASQQSLPAAS